MFSGEGVFPSLVGGGRGNRGYAGGCVLDGEASSSQATPHEPTIILNDQGGARMDVAYDTAPTLRARTGGHEPIVIDAASQANRQTIGESNNEAARVQSYAEGSFSQFREGEVGTLRVSGGCLGGGSETLLVEQQSEEPSTLVVRCGCEGGGKGALISEGLSMTLSTRNGQTLFQPGENEMAVRRLTPVECERLQGFPDDWTRIEWNGKPADQCPKGRRYKAVGNSMAVPVMRWIGEGIAMQR